MQTRVRAVGASLALAVVTLLLAGCHPTPVVVIDDVVGIEDQTAHFQVRLEAVGPGVPQTHVRIELYCTTSPGTAGVADYSGMSGQRCGTILPGTVSTYIDIPLLLDDIDEDRETFSLTLRVVGAGVKRGSAIGAITKNWT
ncbi:hypothetical protein BH18ACT1_BH18ACT1_06400 [soil metagenome]|nr:hypothetical protein [Acidimicrobiia bacterium]